MKKALIITLTVVTATAFTSCKKNWVCNCTTKSGDTYIGGTPKNVTKKDAKAACNAIGAANEDICTTNKN